MGSVFDRWNSDLIKFQRRRDAGLSTDLLAELTALAARVPSLGVAGLDLQAQASAMCHLEKAAILLEAGKYDEAHTQANSCPFSTLLKTDARVRLEVTQSTLLGNVYWFRDQDAKGAAAYYSRALAHPMSRGMAGAGGAAVNLGLCQQTLEQYENAITSFELAARIYENVGRTDKLADVMHCLGNTYRLMGDLDRSVRLLQDSVQLFFKQNHKYGQCLALDDLSRAYAKLAMVRPEKRKEFVEHAREANALACAIGAMVWDKATSDSGRLRVLTERLLNITTTACRLAFAECDPACDTSPDVHSLLGMLAFTKGRIRLADARLAAATLSQVSEDLQEPMMAGIVAAAFLAVDHALQDISAQRAVALVDQFAITDRALAMGMIICRPDDKPVIDATVPELDGLKDVVSHGGFGQRAVAICAEVDRLFQSLERHCTRCSVCPVDPLTITEDERYQLTDWDAELHPLLRRLGELFFPSELVDTLRQFKVKHLVLSVDPLFARLPYAAFFSERGQILDEPWSLSVVTSSMELPRIVHKTRASRSDSPLAWIAPDHEVNSMLGGDAELRTLMSLAHVDELREGNASRGQLTARLQAGQWCHFRGHGYWSGNVDDSGLVMAGRQIFCSGHYPPVTPTPGFLFTAACSTGFAEAAGTEAFGSLIDYDRAGLLGAVYTAWPIIGTAASITTRYFYDALRQCGDAAASLKAAQQRTRAQLPHLYFWAPFIQAGGWDCRGMIRWK